MLNKNASVYNQPGVMRTRRILFFGDSFVAGHGDPQALGWVGRVVVAARKAGVTLAHYNLGVAGETSMAVAARWRIEAARRAVRSADNRVVFAFGAEDTALQAGSPAVALGQSAQMLATCLSSAQAMGLPALVVGPPPVGDGKRIERLQQLTLSYSRICAEFEVPFVGVVDRLLHSTRWVVEAATGDGMHPGAGGYEELAQLVMAGGLTYWLRTGMPLPAVLRDDLAERP